MYHKMYLFNAGRVTWYRKGNLRSFGKNDWVSFTFKGSMCTSKLNSYACKELTTDVYVTV